MIALHRLNGQSVVINTELIETVEAHGVETVIGLVTGNRIVVSENITAVIEAVVQYRKTVYAGAPQLPEFLKMRQGAGRP